MDQWDNNEVSERVPASSTTINDLDFTNNQSLARDDNGPMMKELGFTSTPDLLNELFGTVTDSSQGAHSPATSGDAQPQSGYSAGDGQSSGVRKLTYQQAMQEAENMVVRFEKAPPGLLLGGQSAAGSVGPPREGDGAPRGQKALQVKPEPQFVPGDFSLPRSGSGSNGPATSGDGIPRGQRALQEKPEPKPEPRIAHGDNAPRGQRALQEKPSFKPERKR